MLQTKIAQSYDNRHFHLSAEQLQQMGVKDSDLPALAYQQRKRELLEQAGFGEESIRDDIIVRVRRWPDGQREVVGYPVRRHYQNPFEGKFGINIPKPKVKRGESEDQEKSMASAMQRARRKVRELAKTARLDHLLTLTYRGLMADRERAARDWKAFVRRVRKDSRLVREGDAFHFVAVIEHHKSGGIHIHVGVRGWRDAIALRDAWHAVVGKGNGNVDIQGPKSKGRRRIVGVHRVAAYLSKYITKGTQHKLNERRYWSSKGIEIPERETIGQFRAGTDEESFREGMDATMRYLVQTGANWQGMSTYVSHGRKCFWFSLAEDGFELDDAVCDVEDDEKYCGPH
jgi:hypothetical protein